MQNSDEGVAPVGAGDWIKNGPEIYRRSFALIRSEASLERFPADIEPLVVRMIHASGDTEIAASVRHSDDVARVGRAALEAGAPIFCDANMVRHGITRSRLPADNPVHCFVADSDIARVATERGLTRSAAAVDRWLPELAGSIVAIGNAPTALFYLLERIAAGVPAPAALVGIPVGFVGAVESKDALIAAAATNPTLRYITVAGRRGGSAITAAAINALASRQES